MQNNTSTPCGTSDCTAGDCSQCSSCTSAKTVPSLDPLTEQQVASETVYDGKIIRVTKDTAKLQNDALAIREVVHHPGGACVVPLTDQLEVLMVRQFRYPFGEVTLEIPAGKLEFGEDPKACAIRELSEEVGAAASQICSLGCLYPTPAYNKEVIHMYLATGLQLTQQHLDEDEFLDVVKIPLEKAIRLVMQNRIPDAKTQLALLKTIQIMNSPD